MATNDPTLYGRDLVCIDDADALFSDDIGIGIVRQDAYHRLTNDSVLGSIDGEPPNEATDNWGYDVAKLVGMRADKIPGIQPTLAGVVQKDPRILTADVAIQITNAGDVFKMGKVYVRGTTALGPFSLVMNINQVTPAIFGGSTS